MHKLESRMNFSEPYRMTCPPTLNSTNGYCPELDRLRGQGVAIKISRNQSVAADINQLEYALVHNPFDHVEYLRLNYDVSLLDCAVPASGVATADNSATTEQYQAKIDRCPGYQNGLTLTFEPDPGESICTPIKCTGEESPTCPLIYNYERTREGEASMACREKFQGNMVFTLCAGIV